MVSALVSSSSGQGSSPMVGTSCCVFRQNLTLTVPLSTHVYKWVPANLILGAALRWSGIPPRGSRNTPIVSCTETGVKRKPDGPVGPNADFTFSYLLR